MFLCGTIAGIIQTGSLIHISWHCTLSWLEQQWKLFWVPIEPKSHPHCLGKDPRVTGAEPVCSQSVLSLCLLFHLPGANVTTPIQLLENHPGVKTQKGVSNLLPEYLDQESLEIHMASVLKGFFLARVPFLPMIFYMEAQFVKHKWSCLNLYQRTSRAA